MLMRESAARYHDTGHPHGHERIYRPGGGAAHEHDHGHVHDHTHDHTHVHDHEHDHAHTDAAGRREIEVKEAILGENDRIAEAIQKHLADRNILMVNIMGAPGAGKTSVLVGLIRALGDRIKSYVIEGDIEADFDAVLLQKIGIETIQINTGGACHLDAPLIERALDGLNLTAGSVVFIENIGNLVCPAEFSIGEHAKLLISPVTEGSDKPYKYPLAFEKANLILLNKVDLKPYTAFDEAFFTAGVRALNPDVPIIACSAMTGEGFPEVAAWLLAKRSS